MAEAAFTGGFDGVVRVAKALEVGLVPHQARIPAMRDDVIDVGGCGNTTLPLTLDTEGMGLEVFGSESSPAWSVSTPVGVGALGINLPSTYSLMLGTAGDGREFAAVRVSARPKWLSWDVGNLTCGTRPRG